MFLPKGELIDEDGTVYQGARNQRPAHCVLQAVSRREAGDRHRVDPPGRSGGNRRGDPRHDHGEWRGQVAVPLYRRLGQEGPGLAAGLVPRLCRRPGTDAARSLGVGRLAGRRLGQRRRRRQSGDHLSLVRRQELSCSASFRWMPADGAPRNHRSASAGIRRRGKIRSWLFDADGGFAEGAWTVLDDSVVIKSSSVNPDGATATATMNIACQRQRSFHDRGNGSHRRRQSRRRFRNHRHAASPGPSQVPRRRRVVRPQSRTPYPRNNAAQDEGTSYENAQ